MDFKSYCVHTQSLTVWPCDLMDYGNIPARILDWVAISSSKGSSQHRDQNCITAASTLAGGFFTTERRCKSTLLEQSALKKKKL